MKKLLLTFLIAFITALGLNATTVTKSITSFSSTSGNIDDNISYAAAKGGGTTQVVVKSNEIRIYKPASGKKLGGEITISAANECKINSVTISAGEKTANVNIYLDGSSTATKSNLTFSNKKEVSIDGISASSVRFVDVGADRIDIASIEVTYTTAGGDTPGPKVLGDIKMGSTPVSTDKTTPTTATVKGLGTISFTSANAAAMIVYQDGVQKVSSGGSPITWEAPESTDSEQSFSLRIHSQLQNEGEDLQEKDAYMTVTVPAKGNVSDDFTLITDAGDLYDGMEMYIVSGNIALSTTQNDNNRGQTGVTIKNGILTPTSSAQLITLEATNVTDKPWKFNVGDGYLYAASSSKNYLKTSASPSDNNEKATISIATNGNATITFQGENTHNVLKYNSNSSLFSCYTGGQTAVQIYAKKTMTAVEPGEVTSMPAAVEGVITINKNEEITFSSKDAAKLQVSTQSEPVVGSSYKYTPTEEGEVTITPIDSEGKVYTEKAATFTIKFFVAPEAPTFMPNGGDVDLFSTVKIACATEGATLTYKIGNGEAKTYPADGIKMTQAGEVTITAIATKGSLSTETTKNFTVTDKRKKVYVRFDAKEYEFTVGKEFKSPVAKACTYNNGDFVEIPNFTGTINYESDNTSVAEVNATTGALILKAAGTCNITASLESETYKSDPAHYTLKVNKGLVDGLIEYPVSEFVYTIGSGEQLPVLNKYPDNVDVGYSISHKRVENGVAVYNPATIDEQGNITVNTPGIVTVTATVKANPTETSSYVLEIQSLKEAEIAGTGSATPTGNVYTKVVDNSELNHSTLYAILSYSAGKVYALAPGNAGANEGLKAVLIKEGETALNSTYTIDNSAVANMLYDENGYLTYDYNSTVYYLTSLSLRHMEWTDKASEAQAITYKPWVESSGDGTYFEKSLLLGTSALLCNASEKYFNTFSTDNENFNNTLYNCFLYKVGTAMSSASTVKAPVVHITGGNVYYSPDGEWYWGTEDGNHELSFANETDGADIYYIKSSATPSSANVRAMANSATGTLYSTPFKKSDLDGKKITFWAQKDGQKSAVETLNFNIKTGIEDIDVENAEAIEEEGDARYFNLQGLEVKNPGEGIYIRVANGKATKILKK